MIRRRYLAGLTVAALAGCQQVLGLDPGTLSGGTGGSGGTPSSTASTASGLVTSSTGGAAASSGSTSSSSSSAQTGSSSSTSSSGSTSSTGSSTTSTSATGSSSSGTGGSTPSICDNNVSVLTAAQGFVDDFETAARFPGWYSFADVQSADGGPTMFFDMIARQGPGVGAAGTLWAANTSGAGVMSPTAGGFGAGFGFGMKTGSGQCAGVMAFDGLSFWAKGTAGPDNWLTYQVVVPQTQSVADGGDCVSNCYNHPSKVITLTTTWTQYAIKWTDLKAGLDNAGPVQVNGIILGFSWITPGPDFNVWIDEVTLYSGTPPTGPVGS